MANHKTHQQGAILAGTSGALAALVLGMISLPQALIVFIAGYTGGMAPDLDLDHGRSLRFVFRIITLLLPIVVLWKYPSLHSSIFEGVTNFVLLALVIHFPIRFLFKKLTVHRGIFHSVPAIVIYGALFFLLVGKESDDLPFQKATGIVASLGYFTHLALDEFSSLNFGGGRHKRSLGTALDFVKPNKLVTVIAYAVMAYLLYVVRQQL